MKDVDVVVFVLLAVIIVTNYLIAREIYRIRGREAAYRMLLRGTGSELTQVMESHTKLRKRVDALEQKLGAEQEVTVNGR